MCTCTDVHTLKLVARLQLDTGALVFCQPQGKLAECSGEGEQRRAMLLTWQPSHHTKQVMSTDSTEICGILQRLHPLFISVHIIRTKARCNIITTKTYNLDPDNCLWFFLFYFISFASLLTRCLHTVINGMVFPSLLFLPISSVSASIFAHFSTNHIWFCCSKRCTSVPTGADPSAEETCGGNHYNADPEFESFYEGKRFCAVYV